MTSYHRVLVRKEYIYYYFFVGCPHKSDAIGYVGDTTVLLVGVHRILSVLA